MGGLIKTNDKTHKLLELRQKRLISLNIYNEDIDFKIFIEKVVDNKTQHIFNKKYEEPLRVKKALKLKEIFNNHYKGNLKLNLKWLYNSYCLLLQDPIVGTIKVYDINHYNGFCELLNLLVFEAEVPKRIIEEVFNDI